MRLDGGEAGKAVVCLCFFLVVLSNASRAARQRDERGAEVDMIQRRQGKVKRGRTEYRYRDCPLPSDAKRVRKMLRNGEDEKRIVIDRKKFARLIDIGRNGFGPPCWIGGLIIEAMDRGIDDKMRKVLT